MGGRLPGVSVSCIRLSFLADAVRSTQHGCGTLLGYTTTCTGSDVGVGVGGDDVPGALWRRRPGGYVAKKRLVTARCRSVTEIRVKEPSSALGFTPDTHLPLMACNTVDLTDAVCSSQMRRVQTRGERSEVSPGKNPRYPSLTRLTLRISEKLNDFPM